MSGSTTGPMIAILVIRQTFRHGDSIMAYKNIRFRSIAALSVFTASLVFITPHALAESETVVAEATTSSASAEPASESSESSEKTWSVKVVGGEAEAEMLAIPATDNYGEEFTIYRAGSARVTTPLPVNYPPPTAPGLIEIKTYPSYRQAVHTNKNGNSFWPLFQHISSRDIAMTAPVVTKGVTGPESEESMAFLYRKSDMGKTGMTENDVKVEDTKEVTVISIGHRGIRNQSTINKLKQKLETWLENQPDQKYKSTGETRVLGYNGPEVPNQDKWWEVQVVLENI